MNSTRLLLVIAGVLLALTAARAAGNASRIVWDQRTLVLVQDGGGYGRMVRLPDQEILCSYSRGPNVYVRRSRDEGRTWERETKVAEFAFGIATNAELLVSEWLDTAFLQRASERRNSSLHRQDLFQQR